MSSCTAGGVIKAGIPPGSVISISSECKGLSGRDGIGAVWLAEVHGEAGGVCCGEVRMPDVKGGVAINDGVLFLFPVSRAFRGVFWAKSGGETVAGSVTVVVCVETVSKVSAGWVRQGSRRGLGRSRGTRERRDIDHRCTGRFTWKS